MRQTLKLTVAIALSVGVAAPALAQTFNSGSTGADGAFNPSCTPTPCSTATVTLPPSGIFNFTTINVPASITVKFTKNADNTPVTILASGNVTIMGTIDLSGTAGGPACNGTSLVPNGGAGGPGGYAGGSGSNGLVSATAGTGLGPGSGGAATSTGSPTYGYGGGAGFGSAGSGPGANPGSAYGSPTLLPLIGGSGGGGGYAAFGKTGAGGGGGGGAVLIASSGTVTLTGSLLAKGGNNGVASPWGCGGQSAGGSGSGGAIRIAATAFTGTSGTINVAGGLAGYYGGSNGGVGRIRLEVYANTATTNYSSVPSFSQPAVVALANTPSLKITSVAGVTAPTSPTGSYSTPDITLPTTTTNPVAVAISASNIPTGTVVTVTSSGLAGGSTSATATLSGSSTSSTGTTNLTIPTNEPTVISASATYTLAASIGGGPIYADGEEIEHVRVSATIDGGELVEYITKSGRSIALNSR